MSQSIKDEIVISGMAGRFPECDNVDEFYDKLVNKVDPITADDRRFKAGIFNTPARFGKIKDISKFDNSFFGLMPNETHWMDPQGRILLEVTYEAIVDAGYDPSELRGKKIGVFVGNCFFDRFLSACSASNQENCDGAVIQGYRRGLVASRIYHVFDFKGPSMNVDMACASSGQAFYQAYQSILSGDCEAAIVAGSNIITSPSISVGFKQMKMISKDGKSKAFDKSVNGYVRSEAVTAVFVQKYKDARRNYASVVHMKTSNDGFKIEGLTYPSFNQQKELLTDVWRESNLDPSKIAYVEAHATGTVAGDLTEMAVIDEVFCRGRKEPLLVGSMKSTMGHTEAASSICQIVKLVLSMEREVIPPNMHFNEPHPEIKALVEGRAKVVTELTPFAGPYTAVNSFGFGGSNVHCILKSNSVTLLPKSKKDNLIPQLILYSGRTWDSVKYVLDNTTVEKASREFFALLHKSSYSSTTLKPYRGYKLLELDYDFGDIKLLRDEKRQLWYTFSGVTAHWAAVIDDLMQIKIFEQSIQKSTETLKQFQFGLQERFANNFKTRIPIESKSDKQMPIRSIVSITVVQVALIDVLNELGLKPDGVVGQNHREILCAYAYGCLTAEQTLLSSYYIAQAIDESYDLHEDITRLSTLCYNAQKHYLSDNLEHSRTVSKAMEVNRSSEAGMKAENSLKCDKETPIFSENSENVLFSNEKLLFHLEKVIPNPKVRDERWITCSYPKNDPVAKIASASYFSDCLSLSESFDDALEAIPKEAIVVEIGPHDLHNIVLEKAPRAFHLSLIKADGNNLINLLSTVGKMYIHGLDPDIEKLYPPVAFPVSRNTPLISPLIKWDHSESWNINQWNEFSICPISEYDINLGDISSPNRFLLEHCIDERNLYPATKYVILVCITFVFKYFMDMTGKMPAVLEKVKFMRATMISETSETKFIVHISKATGFFEIMESGMIICTGYVRSPMESEEKCITSDFEIDEKSLILNSKDIYKEFRIRGYESGPSFQGILAANLSGTEGILRWNNNWVTFMDTMLQMSVISLHQRVLLLPIGIEKIIIDMGKHRKLAEKAVKEYEGVPVKYNPETGEYFSGGLYIKNVSVGYQKQRQISQVPVLEEYKFVPYEMELPLDVQTARCQEYIDVCSSISEKILKMYGRDTDQIRKYVDTSKVSEDMIDKYVKSEENCYVLLQFLSEIVNSPVNPGNVKNCVNNYLGVLENDILSQVLLNEFTLRITYEVVLENLFPLNVKKVEIVEIVEGSQTISFMLHQNNPNPNFFKMSYSIMHHDTELLCKDHVPPNASIIAWENKPTLEFRDVDLFILNHLEHSISDIKKILENAAVCLKDEGFILLQAKMQLIPPEIVLSSVGEISIPWFEERTLEQIFEETNLNIICKIFDSFTTTLYLLRKSKTWPDEDLIVNITAHDYDRWVADLKQKMSKTSELLPSRRIWLVSEGCRHSGILGLVNCLRREPGGLSIRCVFTGKENSEIPKFSLEHPFYQKQLEKDLVMNVLQDDSWGSYRHIRCKEDNLTTLTEHAYLNILTMGDLSSFTWVPLSIENISLADDEVICHVYYSSLNFRDIMIATGRIPLSVVPSAAALHDCLIGYEFSGRTSDGKRVMGITSTKGMATTVVAKRKLMLDVPDEWTLEQAATVPIVYVTAYHALIERGNLQKGERVLIHCGSGGVGQAAIGISLHVGCDIYTTVGSEEKREFLKMKFPQLHEDHILNSRDAIFEQHILHATKGEGVDVVLNSLAGDKLLAGLNCLADDGRYLEIGKYDMFNNSEIGMEFFLKNVSFHGICLDIMIQEVKDKLKDSVSEVIDPLKKIIADGVVQPLDATVFNYEEVEQAFRYMATGKHIGKVLLKVREEEIEKKATPSHFQVTAIKKTTFDSQKSYVIIGGLGGMGLELCQLLIDRGARNVILTSRSGVTTGYQKLCLQRWKRNSVNIVISKLDAGKLDEAESLLLLAAKFGSVGGIFNVALVLKDDFFEKQTAQNFIEVCECKVEATKNLDILTRERYPDLDWFVCFSSISCGRGNPTQTNYAYANSVMERICEDRVSKGFSGLAVQWGLVGNVGVIEETMGSSNLILFGTVPQRIRSCLEVLDRFLQQQHPVVSSLVLYDPDKVIRNLERGDLLSYIVNIFGKKDVNSINPESTLSELGMDSLMAVELRQVLECNFNAFYSIPELQKLKVKELKKIINHNDAKRIESTTETQKCNARIQLEKFQISKNLIPAEVIIHMNSITDGLALFFVHSLDGSTFPLSLLAENLSCPVYGIQSTSEAPSDSLENVASYYWKILKSLNIPLQSINLVGYSFGATIAFEMALQAEQDPQSYPGIKNLIFLDGSHNCMTSFHHIFSLGFDEMTGDMKNEVITLTAFVTMFSDDKIILRNTELFNLKSFSERKNYTANKIASLFPNISVDDISALLDAHCAKLQMSFSYTPKHKLKKEVHLVKASESFLAECLSDLYDLEHVCEGKLTSHTVEGNHSNFIQDEPSKEVSNLLKDILANK